MEVSLLLKRCEIALEELLISQELSFHKESKVAKVDIEYNSDHHLTLGL